MAPFIRPNASTRLLGCCRLWCLVGVLAAISFSGCRHAGSRVYHEQMMDEKRKLEDQLYEMAYRYEVLERELYEIQQQHFESGDVGMEPESHMELLPTPDGSPNPVLDPDYVPQIEEAPGADGTPQDPIPIEPPSLDPETLPAPDLSPADGGANGLRPDEAPADTVPVPDISPPDSAMNQSGATRRGIGHVAEIRLNPVYTGGEDFDELPGDDGVAVLIEPRNARGEVLAQPGRVSVVVVDPSAPDDRARVARWDLSEQEVSERIQQSNGKRGILLKLPWPQSRPEHSKLHLFVRYVTNDERNLESDREFFITLNGAIANRWTRRSRSRNNSESPAARTARNGQSPDSAAQTPEANAPQSSDLPVGPAPPVAAPQVTIESPPIRQVTRPQWRPVR